MSESQAENKALLHYPFGMLMPGRNFGSDTYRFGFQNQEKDDEIKGDGNSVNYKYRVHDPRLARFLSVDPLEKDYPWYTPYQFAGNKPIWAVDLDGLEEGDPQHDNGNPLLTYPTRNELEQTFAPSAEENIYNIIENSDFSSKYQITYDFRGQQKFAELFIGTELTEVQQENRRTYSGRVVMITTQLADESLVNEDNPDGRVSGTWKQFRLPPEFIPENTSDTLNPGKDQTRLPRIDLGEGKSIIYVIRVVIEESN